MSFDTGYKQPSRLWLPAVTGLVVLSLDACVAKTTLSDDKHAASFIVTVGWKSTGDGINDRTDTWLLNGVPHEALWQVVNAIDRGSMSNKHCTIRICAEEGVRWESIWKVYTIMGNNNYSYVRLPGDWAGAGPRQLGIVDSQMIGGKELGNLPVWYGWSGLPRFDAKKHIAVVMESDGRISVGRLAMAGQVRELSSSALQAWLKHALASEAIVVADEAGHGRVVVAVDRRTDWLLLQRVIEALVAMGVDSFDWGVIAK